jgi:hypothetical protein
VNRQIMRKAAALGIASITPAMGIVTASQGPASASIKSSCGRNFTPSKATYAETIEHGDDGYGYDQASLREGTIDGDPSIYWGRENSPVRGWVQLDWGNSINSNTYYECRQDIDPSAGDTRNYTQGVILGYNDPPGASAWAFRVCTSTPLSFVTCQPWY